ncbi:hypothetical protein JCM21900_000865 [Sporobolomyces salmonicolor]
MIDTHLHSASAPPRSPLRSPPGPAAAPPTPAAHDALALTLTIRYLPTDAWRAFSVPREWRVGELKRWALEEFGELEPDGDARSVGGTEATRDEQGLRTARNRKIGEDKENEARWAEQAREPGHHGRGQQRKVSHGGMKRFANALVNKLSPHHQHPSPFPANHPSSGAYIPSATSSLSHIPTRRSLSTVLSSPPVTPSSSQLQPLTPTSTSPSARRPRNSEDHSRSSSISGIAFLKESMWAERAGRGEGGAASGGGVGVPIAEPKSPASATAPAYERTRAEANMQRSKSVSDKKGSMPALGVNGPRGGGAEQAALSLAERRRRDRNEKVAAGWHLVSAVMGCSSGDHAIVGAKFVDLDVLTLKPRQLCFDPPLHLYHLPYLHLPRLDVLASSLSSAHVKLNQAEGHGRRKSLGGKAAKSEMVERRVEITFDDGTYAALSAAKDKQAGSLMVLKVLKVCSHSLLLAVFMHGRLTPSRPSAGPFEKVNTLEAILPLPASAVQLHAAASSAVPSLPRSSSTTSLTSLSATTLSPSSPSSTRLHQAHSKGRDVPLVHLTWRSGEYLTCRAMSAEDHERLLGLIGVGDEESGEGERERDKEEMEWRKDVLDLAYASRHGLVAPSDTRLPPPPSRRPPSPTARQHFTSPILEDLEQTPRPRPTPPRASFIPHQLDPRRASTSSIPPVPPIPARPSSRTSFQTRSSSLNLHPASLSPLGPSSRSPLSPTSPFSPLPARAPGPHTPQSLSSTNTIVPTSPRSPTTPISPTWSSSSSSYFSLSPVSLPLHRAKSSIDLSVARSFHGARPSISLTGHIASACPTAGTAVCYNCSQPGHISRDCPNGAAPKKCYSCGDSGHISRECPQNPNAGAGAGFGGPVGGFGGGAAGVCYRCGQPGHISRACPQNAGFGAAGAFGAGAGAGAGGYGYGGFGAPKTCYTCGGVGHLSRECVNPSKCFNCGQVGHISRDCSNAPQQKSCYNCGEAGHISRECPQAAGAGAAAPQA